MMQLLVLAAVLLIQTNSSPDSVFREELENYLARAPFKMSYHYIVEQGDFRQEETDTLFIAGAGRFRLPIWDKIYGSDGYSLFLHDRNTHQTIIDSLRWSDVNLWVRLLNGQLPSGVVVTGIENSSGRFVYHLAYGSLWEGLVVADTTTWAIREIILTELVDQYRHHVLLEPLVPWTAASPRMTTLEDLVGTRIDLR